jgi:hypothetical protein
MKRAPASIVRVATAAMAVLLAACTKDQVQPAGARSTAELKVRPLVCPLAYLRGVRAGVADVPAGVAIVFDGPERVLDLLRANVRAMASASDSQGDPFVVCPCGARILDDPAGAPAAGTNDLGLTSMQAPSSRYIPPSMATVEEIPTGATLVLAAEDNAETDLLRTSVRQAVSAMGLCLSQEGL